MCQCVTECVYNGKRERREYILYTYTSTIYFRFCFLFLKNKFKIERHDIFSTTLPVHFFLHRRRLCDKSSGTPPYSYIHFESGFSLFKPIPYTAITVYTTPILYRVCRLRNKPSERASGEQKCSIYI